MPKIKLMRHELDESEDDEIISLKEYYTVPLPKLEGMMFGCECEHWDVTHKETGECWHDGTELCTCKKFTPRNLQIVVGITEIDVFEFETGCKFERDSFEWWNEFNLWRLKNETISS